MSAAAGRRLDCDLLRVLAMAGVVFLHTAADALRQPIGPLWHFANLITSLATAAVPLFFMLSGALLLGQDQTASMDTLFRRRLPKLLAPLLAWSAVAILLTGLMEGPQAAVNKLIPLLNTPVLVPYWFLYALVPIYLISPFLKRMADGLTDAHWNYLVGLWLVVTVGWNTLYDLAPAGAWKTALTVHWTLNLNFVGGYVGYFLLGARLARLEKLPRRGALWGVVLATTALISAGTLWLTGSTGAYDERMKSYVHIFTAVLSTALFLLVRADTEHRSSGRLLTALSSLSFGVYLVHPLAIAFWRLVWPAWLPALDTIPGLCLTYLLSLLGSLLGIWAVASLRPLCWVFTGQRFDEACRTCNLFTLLGRKERT